MRVTRGNQSAKYCTTGDNGDGFETGGGLATVIALEMGAIPEDGVALCARACAGSITERASTAAAPIAARTKEVSAVFRIFMAQPLCHGTSIMTSIIASRIETTLRRARAARGLTQDELARRAGLSRQALGAIESGAYQPGVGAALALARELGHSVEALFGTPAEPAHLEADWMDKLDTRGGGARGGATPERG